MRLLFVSVSLIFAAVSVFAETEAAGFEGRSFLCIPVPNKGGYGQFKLEFRSADTMWRSNVAGGGRYTYSTSGDQVNAKSTNTGEQWRFRLSKVQGQFGTYTLTDPGLPVTYCAELHEWIQWRPADP